MTSKFPLSPEEVFMAKSSNKEMNQLSKEALQTALIELLIEQDLDAISITQLSEKAGVSRMTYYRNYDSITELFYDTLDVLFKEIIYLGQQTLLDGNWHEFWLALYTFCYSNQRVVRIMLNTSQNTLVLDYLNQAFAYISDDPFHRYRSLAYIGVTYNLLVEWARNDFDVLPEEIAELCSQIINPDQNATVPDKYRFTN